MRNRTVLRRCVAGTAVSALAVAMLPALSTAAFASHVSAVQLYSPLTAAVSGSSDGANSTVTLAADAPTGTSAVRFSFTPTAGTASVIATDTSAPFTTEWSTATLSGTGTIAAEALNASNVVLSTDTTSITINNALATVHISSPTSGASLGVFGGTAILSGSTSSSLVPEASEVTGTSAGPGAGAYVPVTPGTASGGITPWTAIIPVAGVATATVGVNEAWLNVRTTDAAATDETVQVSTYVQKVTTATVAPTSANVPTAGTKDFVLTVLDQNGKPIAGANVSLDRNMDGTPDAATAATTDVNGQHTFTVGAAVTAGTETVGFIVNAGAAGPYNAATDFRPTATLTTYAPVPSSIAIVPSVTTKTSFAAGAEYDAVTVKAVVKDQNGALCNATCVASVVTTGTRTDNGTTAAPVSVASATNASGEVAYTAAQKPATNATHSGQDVFAAYIEKDGVAGFSGNDVAASGLTLKYGPASIDFDVCGTNTGDCNSQAQIGTNKSITVNENILGTGLAGRKVTLVLTGTDATFPTAQTDASVTRTDATHASCILSAAGSCTVVVSDPTVGSDTLTATDAGKPATATTPAEPANGAVSVLTLALRTLSVALDATENDLSTIITPGQTSYTDDPAIPGAALRYEGYLFDANSNVLANVPVSISVDHGYFTKDTSDASNNAVKLTWATTPVNGAKVGALVNLGTTKTLQTDDSGYYSFVLSIARDSAFDASGSVHVNAVVTSLGVSKTLANPADDCGICTPANEDFPETFVTNGDPMNLDQVAVIEVDGKTLSGAVPTVQTRKAGFTATDQFGNRTGTSGTLSNTGVGGVDGGALCNTTSKVLDGSFTAAPSSGVVCSTTSGDESLKATVADSSTKFVLTGTPAAVTSFDTTAGTAHTASAGPISWYVQAIKVSDGASYTFTATPAAGAGGTYPVGTTVTVSVTALDQHGQPIADKPVSFFRSGPGTQSGSDTTKKTNAAGMAGYSFSGSEAGTAQITSIVTDGSGNELARGVTSVTFKAPVVPVTFKITSPASGTKVIGGTRVYFYCAGAKAGEIVTVYQKLAGQTSYTRLLGGALVHADGTCLYRRVISRTSYIYFAGANGHTVSAQVRV